MPQEQQQSGSQKMYFDLSGRGGLAPRWFGDEGDTIAQYPQYRYIGDADQNPSLVNVTNATQFSSGIYNPTRRYGYMCPSPATFTTLTTPSTAFSSEMRATHYDPNMLTTFAGDNSATPRLWVGTENNTTWTDSAYTFTGGQFISDIETYQIYGVRKTFVAFNKSSSVGDIGIFTASSGASVSGTVSWLKGAASGGINTGGGDVFMTVADNGFMYIGDGNLVHKVDGTVATGGANGTVTANVLVAPITYTFLDAVDFKGSMWFAIVDTPQGNENATAYSGTTCGVYVWDRQSTIVDMTDFIPLRGVKSIKRIFVTNTGKVRLICLSSKRTTQIREFDGSVFQIIDEEAMVAYPLYRDSVAQAGDLVYWMGGDGRIYAYGSIVPGETEQNYIIGDATAYVPNTNARAGAILFVYNNGDLTTSKTAITLSTYTATPSVNNLRWFPNGTGATPSTSQVFTLVKYFPIPVKINYVRVYHNAANTSGSTVQGTLNIYLNQATSANKQFNITRDDIAKGYRYCEINQGLKNVVTGIQAGIQWASVSTSDTTDWMPRLLEVDYEPIPRLL